MGLVFGTNDNTTIYRFLFCAPPFWLCMKGTCNEFALIKCLISLSECKIILRTVHYVWCIAFAFSSKHQKKTQSVYCFANVFGDYYFVVTRNVKNSETLGHQIVIFLTISDINAIYGTACWLHLQLKCVHLISLSANFSSRLLTASFELTCLLVESGGDTNQTGKGISPWRTMWVARVSV